jgi:hypothetical protein
MTAATAPTTPSSKHSHTGSPTGGCAADVTSPTPPNMADSPQRAAAYIRESTEEQDQGFSPDAQRQAIANFAPENDLELIGEYCDFHSGWRKSEARPDFQRLMADAAAGKLWAKDNRIVAVKPNPAFADYFTAASEVRARTQKPTRTMRQQRRERRGSNPRSAPH